ncbi:uncharacterized protein [Amphiura filiformis]|uniref:uncharacterized protein n=1 Tax=Amphiura filiformis TaxID=82378 RepID=UPI003B216EDA
MMNSDDMTIGKCINYCLDFNSPTTSIQYAGLETGNQCHCGEEEVDYDKFGRRHNEACNPSGRPCAGDSTQACGGDFAIAVYDLFQLTCSVPSLINGYITTDSSGSIPTTVSVRMYVTFYCHVGYYLDGNSQLQCIVTTSNVTTWDNLIPVCRAVQVTCPYIARGTSGQITITRPTITGFPDTNAVTYSYSSAGPSISGQSLGSYSYGQTLYHHLSNLQTGTNEILVTASDGQGSRAQCSFTYKRTAVQVTCPNVAPGTAGRITVSRPIITGFLNNNDVTYSYYYSNEAANILNQLHATFLYWRTPHMLSNLHNGMNEILVIASDGPGSIAECSFTYERTAGITCPYVTPGTEDQIIITRPIIAGFPNTNAVTFSYIYSNAAASIFYEFLASFPYLQMSHELPDLQHGTNQILVSASDARNTAQCNFTYERTGSVVLTTRSSEEAVSSTQVPNTSQSPSYKVPSDPGSTLDSYQMIIICSGAGGGALLLIIILILLVCRVKRNSKRKYERQRLQEQPESIPTSTRPISLLDRSSEDPTAENMYQETPLHASPNQSNQRNDQEPDLTYSYASVSPTSYTHGDPGQTPGVTYDYASVPINGPKVGEPQANQSKQQNGQEPDLTYSYASVSPTSRIHGDPGQTPQVTYDYASVPINGPKVGESIANQSKQQNGQEPDLTYSYASVSPTSRIHGDPGQTPQVTYDYASVPINGPKVGESIANQSKQQNGQEPDLTYSYASVSINQPHVRDPSPSNDHHRNEDVPSTHDPELVLEESYEYATVTKNRNTSPNHSDERNRNEDLASTSRTHGDCGHEPGVTYDYASVPISRPKLGEPQANESKQQNEHINTQTTPGGSGQAPEQAYSYATVPITRPNGSEQKLVIGDRSEDEEEGWMDNSVYDMAEGNDADNRNETEGWEENTLYVSSDR